MRGCYSSSVSDTRYPSRIGIRSAAAHGFIRVLLVLRVRGFGEPLDRAESLVPLCAELADGRGGLVEALGFHLVEDLPALLAPADQPGPLEHDQVLGDGLPSERHPPGQPAGADRAVADQEVEDLAARRGGEGAP